jgi:hypothetical protein
MPQSTRLVWALCDLVDFNYVNEIPMRILGAYDANDSKTKKPIYFKVVKKTFTSINVEIKTQPTSENFDLQTDILCILHFRKA